MKRRKLSICLLSACTAIAGASVFAQVPAAPTTQPNGVEAAPPDRRDLTGMPEGPPAIRRGFGGAGNFGGGFGGGGPYAGRFGGGGRMDFPPSPEELESVTKFMNDYSPNRQKVFESLPDDKKANLKMLAVRAYRSYQRALRDDPDVAKIFLSRIQLEDQIFSLAAQLRTAGASQRESLKVELRQHFSDLVGLNIQERELRITKLENTLKDERAHLADDSQNREKLVDQKLDALLESGRKTAPDGHSRVFETAPDGAMGSAPR